MVGRGSTSPSLTLHPEVKKGTNLLDNNNIIIKLGADKKLSGVRPCSQVPVPMCCWKYISWENLTRGLVANFHTLLNCVTRYIHHGDILI